MAHSRATAAAAPLLLAWLLLLSCPPAVLAQFLVSLPAKRYHGNCSFKYTAAAAAWVLGRRAGCGAPPHGWLRRRCLLGAGHSAWAVQHAHV